MVEEALHWRTYLPVFALSVLFLPPMIIVAEKLRKAQAVFLCGRSHAGGGRSRTGLERVLCIAFAMLVLFFGAFNFLEAVLPASVTRIAPADMKGTAMGLFSSAQFLGAFSGGLVGGLLLASGDYATTFAWLAAILCTWFALALTMKAPPHLKSKIVSLKDLEQDDIAHFVERATAISGVQRGFGIRNRPRRLPQGRPQLQRRRSANPALQPLLNLYPVIPAYAGMTLKGCHSSAGWNPESKSRFRKHWIPASAGMTVLPGIARSLKI